MWKLQGRTPLPIAIDKKNNAENQVNCVDTEIAVSKTSIEQEW